MLVLMQGQIKGTVGGGCGEAEVWQEARALATRGGTTSQVHVDLTEGPESENGKVCGGRFDVFLERWSATDSILEPLEAALADPRDKVLVTYLGPDLPPEWKKESAPAQWEAWSEHLPGTHFLLDCVRPGSDVPSALVEQAREVLRRGQSRTISVDLPRPQAFFVDILGQAPDLVIAGAGHIARPLCEMAALCGYRVTVIDDRSEYARGEFFPRAHRVVCQDFAHAFRDYPWGQLSHAVLVTRGHKHDEECLRQLIGMDLGYVGMIGSRRRTRAVLDELAAEGVSAEWLQRIYAPIGVDIGAQTPEEISVAILGEMIKIRRGGKARSMRLSSE